jgi:putative PIN family toxin of toxin-antitoxin system
MRMNDRVVIDSSVLVAAMKSGGGASRAVLRLTVKSKLDVLIGQKLFSEYEDVLSRPGLFDRSVLNASEREELFNAFLRACIWTRVFFLWRPNLRDEGDNHLIELAIAGTANAIITHNVRDLLAGELKFPQFEVKTPATFLRQWRHENGHDDDKNA